MEGVGDGVIDAGALYSAIPAPAVASLAATKKIRLVTANEKLLEAVAGKENVVPLYIAAQTYKGQSEGAFVWSVVSGTYFSDEVSADDVYNWTKAILEHKDELQKVHPMGKNARLLTKKELETIPVPLHPGILRYAKEIGVSY
jgi:TRAP transporter TAXI family solute receptor